MEGMNNRRVKSRPKRGKTDKREDDGKQTVRRERDQKV